MDFTTNYCGPYYSNGAIQSSVIGSRPPVDDLDHCCFIHDALLSGETPDYEFADKLFIDCTAKIDDRRARIYSSLVKYGNHPRLMLRALPFMGSVLGLGTSTLAAENQLLNNNAQYGVRGTGNDMRGDFFFPNRAPVTTRHNIEPPRSVGDMPAVRPSGVGHVGDEVDDGFVDDTTCCGCLAGMHVPGGQVATGLMTDNSPENPRAAFAPGIAAPSVYYGTYQRRRRRRRGRRRRRDVT